MSSSTESRQPDNYTDSDGIGNSDVEILSTEWDRDVEVEKDYWFGKKYLECIVAEDLFQRTSLHETIASIDSKLEAAMRHFPAQQHLSALRSRGISTSDFNASNEEEDAHWALVSLTGAIVRKGSREQKALLISTLRVASSMEGPTGYRDNTGSSSVLDANPSTGNNGQHWKAFTTTGTNDAELASYSTALKEYADKLGLVPIYRVETLSTYPPHFKATLTLKGSTFEGEAKTKKQARHHAARDACERFEVQIPRIGE